MSISYSEISKFLSEAKKKKPLTTGDCDAPAVDDSDVKITEQSFDINVSGHRKAQRDQKIRNLATGGSTAGERAAASGKLKGPTLPLANSFELEGEVVSEGKPYKVGDTIPASATKTKVKPVGAARFKFSVDKTGLKGPEKPFTEETLEEKKKGLWDNIHAKRKRGEKPAKPGDEDYPKTLDIDEAAPMVAAIGRQLLAKAAADKIKKMKEKKEKEEEEKEEEEVSESAAWTRKEGKNKAGGLNEKGRKSYERENPGSDLKAPSKEKGNKRRASFCARMKGMKKKLTSAKTASDPDSRINKSLRAWDC